MWLRIREVPLRGQDCTSRECWADRQSQARWALSQGLVTTSPSLLPATSPSKPSFCIVFANGSLMPPSLMLWTSCEAIIGNLKHVRMPKFTWKASTFTFASHNIPSIYGNQSRQTLSPRHLWRNQFCSYSLWNIWQRQSSMALSCPLTPGRIYK